MPCPKSNFCTSAYLCKMPLHKINALHKPVLLNFCTSALKIPAPEKTRTYPMHTHFPPPSLFHYTSAQVRQNPLHKPILLMHSRYYIAYTSTQVKTERRQSP